MPSPKINDDIVVMGESFVRPLVANQESATIEQDFIDAAIDQSMHSDEPVQASDSCNRYD